MNKHLNIMLIDDDDDDNYFHEIAIKTNNSENNVIVKNSGIKALEYLKSETESKLPHLDLIFLDINMPRMNGWEFLNAYGLLEKESQSEAIIIMLSTSRNLEDKARANLWSFVYDYVSKPLTKDKVEIIINKYFTEENNAKSKAVI